VTRRRFLISVWPWRSAAYLLTSAPVAAAAIVPLFFLGLPWLGILAVLNDSGGDAPLAAAVLLFLVGAVLIAVFGPWVSLPLAALERRRMRIVDTRPLESGHRQPAPGLWPWLLTRYTEAATWRELGYAILLVTVAPALYLVALLVVLMVGALLLTPLLLVGGGESVVLGSGTAGTFGEALPYGLVGLVLLPGVPYLLALLAGTHGTVARALLHGRSREALHAQLVEVSRSRARLVDAFETERRRIERDLHDGAQRRLVSLTLQLGLARLDLLPDSAAGKSVAEAHEQAKQTMAELRELIRGIHPQVLTDRGLPVALRSLADDAAIPVTVDVGLPGRLPSHLEATAYFVVAEALTNVVKHSGATRASVSAHRQADTLVVEVSDNGLGGADPRRGSGLTGLADRAAVVDGRMFLSSPAGGPTLIRVELSCQPTHPSFE
jgi:signal transduction histidine kinase